MHPTPRSIADRLYSLPESEFIKRFGDPLPEVPRPVPELSRHFSADRLFGVRSWFLPEYQAVVTARFPPLAEGGPHALSFLFGWRLGENLLDQLAWTGFPRPDIDPTYVVGESIREGGKTTAYLPGPPLLTALTYTVRVKSNEAKVWVWSERPPEPAFGDTVQRYRNTFDWVGTMYFRDLAAVEARTGASYPPGHERMRRLI